MSDPGVWTAIFVIVGLLAGTAGGVLLWMSGMRPHAAVVAGGGFVITVVLFLITVAQFATN
jgi:hypothetical protein